MPGFGARSLFLIVAALLALLVLLGVTAGSIGAVRLLAVAVLLLVVALFERGP